MVAGLALLCKRLDSMDGRTDGRTNSGQSQFGDVLRISVRFDGRDIASGPRMREDMAWMWPREWLSKLSGIAGNRPDRSTGQQTPTVWSAGGRRA